MSKILKLIAKVEHMNRSPIIAGISGASLTAPSAQHEDAWGFDDSTEDRPRLKRRSLRNLLLVLIVLMALITPASLVIAYMSVTEMGKSRVMSEQFINDHKDSQEKIGQLQNAVAVLQESAHKQSDEISGLQVNFQQFRKESDDLSVDQGILKITVDDLKATDKLLLDKTILLSNEIKKVKDMTGNVNEGLKEIQLKLAGNQP